VFGWLPHLAVGLLAVPFIVSQNSWFEWSNALWLLELQTAHVSAHTLPTFFIDAPNQYFYPQMVFYAGPALSVLAYPSLVFGAWPVLAAVTAGAFVAASAGISWTARNLGVSPRLAWLPGVMFASTPYVVSDLYGRGAWAELIAVGALAVALGAATSLTSGRARSPRLTVAALALAVAAIAGTHNLTLLYGALFAVPLAIALLPLLRGRPGELIRRHGLVAVGAVLGVALCGVFLAPDVWLAGRTQISGASTSLLVVLWPFETIGQLLTPWNAQPAGTIGSALHTQTLVAPLVWILCVLEVARWRRQLHRRTALAVAGLGLLGFAITLLVVDPSWWLSFPSLLQSIQFSFRLISFLAIVTVLAVVALLSRPAVRTSRVAIAGLIVVASWQLALAADLAVSSSAFPSGRVNPAAVKASTLPPAFGANFLQATEYRLAVPTPVATPTETASVKPIGDDTPTTVMLFGSQRPGTFIGTRVVASPLIRVTGDARVVGTTVDGFDVLQVNSRARRPWRATVTSVCGSCVRALIGDAPLALLAGRVATLLSALALVGLVSFPMLRRAKRALVSRLRGRTPNAGGSEESPSAQSA
jgi:hypothetical protein